jgi:hypothetical protein
MLEIHVQLMTGSKHNNKYFVVSFCIKSLYPLRGRGPTVSVKKILNLRGRGPTVSVKNILNLPKHRYLYFLYCRLLLTEQATYFSRDIKALWPNHC